MIDVVSRETLGNPRLTHVAAMPRTELVFHVKQYSACEAVQALVNSLVACGARVAPPTVQSLADWIARAGSAAGLTHYSSPATVVANAMLPLATILPYMDAQKSRTIAEIGPGSGALGLTLALVRPDVHVTLIDRSRRSQTFIDATIRRFRITNATAIRASLPITSSTLVGGPYDAVLLRAFARAGVATRAAISVARPNGLILALCAAGDAKFRGPWPGLALVADVPSGVDRLSLVVLRLADARAAPTPS